MLLPNHTLVEAWAVGHRVRREAIGLRTAELTDGLSVSIGVSSMPESSSDPTQLCDLADRAMYASKDAGRGRVSCSNPEIIASRLQDIIDNGSLKLGSR